MGLLINEYVANGNVHNNAYAKVNNVRYDNNSKLAIFDVEVYTAKDANLLKQKGLLIDVVGNNMVKVTPDVNMIAQCYDSVSAEVTRAKAQIAGLNAVIATIPEDQRMEKAKAERQLYMLSTRPLLKLDGVVAVL